MNQQAFRKLRILFGLPQELGIEPDHMFYRPFRCSVLVDIVGDRPCLAPIVLQRLWMEKDETACAVLRGFMSNHPVRPVVEDKPVVGHVWCPDGSWQPVHFLEPLPGGRAIYEENWIVYRIMADPFSWSNETDDGNPLVNVDVFLEPIPESQVEYLTKLLSATEDNDENESA